MSSKQDFHGIGGLPDCLLPLVEIEIRVKVMLSRKETRGDGFKSL